jgi:adenylate cyclase
MNGLDEIVAWMVDGCRSARESGDVLTQLCDRLVAIGVPLARSAVFVRTLHPQIMGRRFLWRPESGTEVSEAGFETFDDPGYIMSPVVRVYSTRTGMRRRLSDPDCPIDFPILAEFRAQGLTDYLVQPLVFSNGEVHVATWSSAAPGGFPDAAIAALEAVSRPLARVAEVRGLRRVATNLLDTYVGWQAGARILGGKIRRGDVETIRAAIWLSDMRGFSARADRMPGRALIDLLNRYYDCQVPAIRDAGGEVLKFMGDGLLAIFPAGEADAGIACRRAFDAACAARAQVAGGDWGGLEQPGALRFGVALHFGDVLYGNIGSANRLDFTCIGPAINLAARIEKLSGEIGRTILASEDFARHCAGVALQPLGAFAFKGVAAEQTVYGIP